MVVSAPSRSSPFQRRTRRGNGPGDVDTLVRAAAAPSVQPQFVESVPGSGASLLRASPTSASSLPGPDITSSRAGQLTRSRTRATRGTGSASAPPKTRAANARLAHPRDRRHRWRAAPRELPAADHRLDPGADRLCRQLRHLPLRQQGATQVVRLRQGRHRRTQHRRGLRRRGLRADPAHLEACARRRRIELRSIRARWATDAWCMRAVWWYRRSTAMAARWASSRDSRHHRAKGRPGRSCRHRRWGGGPAHGRAAHDFQQPTHHHHPTQPLPRATAHRRGPGAKFVDPSLQAARRGAELIRRLTFSRRQSLHTPPRSGGRAGA